MLFVIGLLIVVALFSLLYFSILRFGFRLQTELYRKVFLRIYFVSLGSLAIVYLWYYLNLNNNIYTGFFALVLFVFPYLLLMPSFRFSLTKAILAVVVYKIIFIAFVFGLFLFAWIMVGKFMMQNF